MTTICLSRSLRGGRLFSHGHDAVPPPWLGARIEIMQRTRRLVPWLSQNCHKVSLRSSFQAAAA